MRHTPEPWYKASTRQWTMQGVGADRDGNPCTILIGNHNFDDCDANEDRAIACVNACTGMSDPAGFVEEARELLACIDKLGLRKLVAGWHGEGRPNGPYPPHPKDLGCKLDTTCGLVVMIDRAAEALRKHDAALSAKEAE